VYWIAESCSTLQFPAFDVGQKILFAKPQVAAYFHEGDAILSSAAGVLVQPGQLHAQDFSGLFWGQQMLDCLGLVHISDSLGWKPKQGAPHTRHWNVERPRNLP